MQVKLVTLPFFDISNTLVRSILLFEGQKKPNQNIQIWEHILMQIKNPLIYIFMSKVVKWWILGETYRGLIVGDHCFIGNSALS